MISGIVTQIAIYPTAGAEAVLLEEVEAREGLGLVGDRCALALGSFQKGGEMGSRQVTIIGEEDLLVAGFTLGESRRGIAIRCFRDEHNVEKPVDDWLELAWLQGRAECALGDARVLFGKYCDPCHRPSKLSGKTGFKRALYGKAGYAVEVTKSGIIRVGDRLIPPPKGYK